MAGLFIGVSLLIVSNVCMSPYFVQNLMHMYHHDVDFSCESTRDSTHMFREQSLTWCQLDLEGSHVISLFTVRGNFSTTDGYRANAHKSSMTQRPSPHFHVAPTHGLPWAAFGLVR
ncbi:hypothetical protein BCR44DRAFT_1099127 [Catenaria anguillulae PL171]|uniref:Uncharacterized protein n=1 Tax=Catenaria anguillulae PL171 TaxID=765915 RepID=A0A1Y2I429_9FUNG|nr:hypothetical protein BCR44DRAFT_1099127 [Catenaria anguillulae PL171]